MIIKALTDNFFVTNGFRIHVEMTEDFHSEGREVKVFYSDLAGPAKDDDTVNVAREKFKEVLRINGLLPYVKECFVLDANEVGLVTHSRSVRRLRSEYKADPNWVKYELHCKLKAFADLMYDKYMNNEVFVQRSFALMLRELEDLSQS